MPKKTNMQPELTTKMASEFTVSKETDIKHRVWCAVRDLLRRKDLEEVLVSYGLTRAQYDRYKDTLPE